MSFHIALPPRRSGPTALSGFQGADFGSPNRGLVYFPTLDTRREVDDWTRQELTRRARWLYNNVGMVRRIVNGISRMTVGTGIRPRPRTRDTDWNEIALKDFNNTAGSRIVFDVGGRYNFYQAQRALMRCKLKDGSGFSMMAKTDAGAPAARLFESHQIGTGSGKVGTTSSGAQWYDGVLGNNVNRAIAYRLLTDNNGTADISATDMICFTDYERPGQFLGPTALYHAVNHSLDMAEMTGFYKQAIKNAGTIGYSIENATRAKGMGAGVHKILVGEDGKPRTVRVEQAFRGGKVVELEPGAELKMVADTRPHPNILGFWDYLARDISWGVGMSPEIIWDIHNLGGANTRFIIADAQEYVEEQQDELIEIFCKRYWVYQTAVKLKMGLLPPCQDPEWWHCDWMRPRKLTVDRSRDGKLYIELQGRGMLSLARWYAEQGQDWKEEMIQYLDEKAWIKVEAGKRDLTLDDIFGAGIPGQPPLDQTDSLPVGDDKPNPQKDPDTDPANNPPEDDDE